MRIDPFFYSASFGVMAYLFSRNAFGFPFAGGIMAGALVFAFCSLGLEELRR